MLSIERSAVMSAIFLYPSVRDSPNLAPDFCFTITLSGVSFSMVMIEMQNFVCFNDFFFFAVNVLPFRKRLGKILSMMAGRSFRVSMYETGQGPCLAPVC